MSDTADKLTLAVEGFRVAVREFLDAFGDPSDWWAILEGQWPDRFIVLNRYVRTGQQPPYIFND